MKVRRYQAVLPKEGPFRSWRDCLELARKECIGRARAELGATAVFLNEETRVEERLLGLWRREVVEMLFATDLEGTTLEGQGRPVPTAGKAAVAAPAPASEDGKAMDPEAVSRLEGQMKEIADSVRALSREIEEGGFTPLSAPPSTNGKPVNAPVRHPHLWAKLIDAEVPEPLIEKLLARIPDLLQGDAALQALHVVIRDAFRTTRFTEPVRGQTRIVALIGPTGVGKTTTIAKLAAPFALGGKMKVGLVTMDTYRIAAVEQLRTYAEIMDVPVRVAHGRRDIAQALESLASCDMIFLDTAGRSQKNTTQVSELQAVLEGIPCDPHLVLPATAKPRDLRECVARFGAVNPRSLILTKLDETNTLGPLLALVMDSGVPISYVTVGQRVPEDIEPADPDRLAKRLLQG